MSRIAYRNDIKFTREKLDIIRAANNICRSYARQGFNLTLRQLYYRFVTMGAIPNTVQEYKRLGAIINDARLAGLLDWDYIVDRTRSVRSFASWLSIEEYVKSTLGGYATDLWARQPTRVEVWVEKDALIDIVGRACSGEQTPYFSCRGYTSQSEMWGAAQRIGSILRGGQDVVILHLGDHDPSGVDMSRDIEDRLDMFVARDDVLTLQEIASRRGPMPERGTEEWRALMSALAQVRRGWGKLRVQRIALTMEQVRQYDPPPNPAKVKDSRAKKYIERWGSDSWELDALEPATLTQLIAAAIAELRNDSLWREDVAAMRKQRTELQQAAKRWPEVARFLNGGGQ